MPKQPTVTNNNVADGCEPFWSLPLSRRQRMRFQASERREKRLEEALADAINCFDNHPERITSQRIERWRDALKKKGNGAYTPSPRGEEMMREIEKRAGAQQFDDGSEYVPADIIEGDRAIATHCETFLLYGKMKHEDRMKRITQSIADYREAHARRARNGQRPV